MRSVGSIRTAGYLTAGILLIFLFAVFLPLRIGQGSGDSLDPRTWRSRQNLSDRDAAFLEEGTDKAGKAREKGVTISTRPKGAKDNYVAPEKRPQWPHAAAPGVVKTLTALRAASVQLPIPEGTRIWESRTLAPEEMGEDSAAYVDRVVARLLAAFTESSRLSVTLKVETQIWDRLSPRRQDRARESLAKLRTSQRGDLALESLAGIVGAKLLVDPEGGLSIVSEGTEDLATRRWLNLARAREAFGEETPPPWRDGLERKLAEKAVDFEAVREELGAALLRFSDAAGVSVYLDSALEAEMISRKIDLRVQKLPARDCLRLLLDPLGLEVSLEPDGLVVADATKARARNQALQAPYQSAQLALDRKLTLETKGLLARSLPAAIEQATGVPVVLDEAAWNREQPLDLPSGTRTLRATLDDLAHRNQLGWRMLDGEIYLW